ncbi:MAG TPA: fucose isomerase, partial [Bryobacteraceae bacterium]|nr:fucose isomerase [Bryobacteraceae bacterium]
MAQPVYLVANGDLRLSANRKCWPAQEAAEQAVTAAFARFGREVRRGHSFDPVKGHGFIDSQKRGMEVFREIPSDAPLVVVEAVWQYSHHLLHGLYSHRGPILTVANWSGQWPGLVGMLNLNGSLTKAGVRYTSLWSNDFTDDFFLKNLQRWLDGNPAEYDLSHVRPLEGLKLPEA